jgi:3-phytase
MTLPTPFRAAPAALALLLAACASTPRDPSSTSHPLPTAREATRVAEAFVTAPLPAHEIDSVSAWTAPDGATWLIATGKESHQLVVYDGDSGALLRTVGGRGDAPGEFDRPNGIAVFADRVFVVERDNHRVQVLSLPDLAPVLVFGADELRSPYGLWMHETAPGELELFVTDSFMADYRTETLPPLAELDERVKRYRITLETPEPTATLAGRFGDTTAAGALRMVESIAGDPPNDRLLIAEEDVRVGTTLREYRMDGTYTGRDLPPRHFQAQAEGVALWSCPDGSGYWITADQSSDRTVFHLFERRGLAFVGSFAGDHVALTDGIWLHASGTARFPGGVLYAAHDDAGVGAFDWRDIAKALGLREGCGQ